MDTLSSLRAGKLAGATRLDLSGGLSTFPREVFDLADSLEILNLSQNHLSSLPDDFNRLNKLRILFCSDNDFAHLPAVLGDCASLSMIGFKSNQIETVDEAALPPLLRWLILTDNRLSHLPASLGRCTRLQKLMLSGNRLEHLPDEMAACTNLELIRLAANRLSTLPDWLFDLPRLSWLALAGNPWCATSAKAQTLAQITWASLQLLDKLGEGASGIIHQAQWQDREVAVKVFKSAVTSDGLPAEEMAACLAAGTHPNLISVLGQIANHPGGNDGLVMSLIAPEFTNLANPPSLDSCTRDLYADSSRFTLPMLLRIALGIASAAEHLHDRGLMHGDLYAHNVLVNAQGDCLLGDFGAATFYPATGSAMQRIEVRAFGCLLEELLDRCEGSADLDDLWALQVRCVTADVAVRPLFADLREALHQLQR